MAETASTKTGVRVAVDAVGGDYAEMGIYHVGDLAAGEKTADVQDFGLVDADHLVLEKLGELLLVAKAFAGGYGNRD